MDRFYELKVYAGAEPDHVTLQDSQVRRALSTPDFFLVIVSGVEVGAGPPRVRIIVSPLTQLSVSEDTSLGFDGVRQSRSVVYDFAATQDETTGQEAPGSPTTSS